MAIRVKPITEREFTAMVLRFAHLHGWRTLHLEPARSRSGRWITAMQGTGKGFPDALFLRGFQFVAAELKVGKRRLTPEQIAWLNALEAAGVATFCWRETDWPAIERTLGTPMPAG